MSDKMTPMPFGQLVNWVLQELKKQDTVFGVYRPYYAEMKHRREIFGRPLETPIGPAAGPHTQLTQNIVAAYVAGSRFFELKTVQIMDGDELAACVNKPCIKADDECYNCEWSTELYVPQAMEEYIKAWFLLHVLAKELSFGNTDGFQFNISVGYDLAGIQSPKIDTFLETMKEAKENAVFQSCKQYLLDHAGLFEQVTEADIEQIPSDICNCVTISTLHGCPPQEIEKIARYLIQEKGFHTFIKCNPTLLGYEFARKTMDEMGYDYVAFGDFHFLDDLQYVDAIPMLGRLMKLSDEQNLEFGVKITNTFPVDVKQHELPGEEMYMSGKSLYPLSITLAAKLSEEFGGKLRISYSGGADYYNIEQVISAGVWPVTMATTLLKPGGYQRLLQIAKKVEQEHAVFEGIDVESLKAVAKAAVTDARHVKAIKPLPSRKMRRQVPLTDCFAAPCKEGCPIHQDITAYMKLAGEEKYKEALEVILDKNPLPFITGTICAHNCMSKCTRNFYEEPVHIRDMKLVAAKGGYEEVYASVTKSAVTSAKKAAIVGGGPAGLAAAYFLLKRGMNVTIFEQHGVLGGVVRHVIPDFRITAEAIEKDIALIMKMGAEVKLHTKVNQLEELKKAGYDYVILATGASKPGELKLESGKTKNALEFLTELKERDGKTDIGKNIVVIGGGNTAMDTARAAKRTEGVEQVYLVYRRTKRYMPADEEELIMAVKDGVGLKELLSPVRLEEGHLICDVLRLAKLDASGRPSVEKTGDIVMVPADTVIASVGEQVETAFFKRNGIAVSASGRALVDAETLESGQKGIYIIGDGLNGPATVVEGIRDAKKAAEGILANMLSEEHEPKVTEDEIYAKRGILEDEKKGFAEAGRCLSCGVICENCAEVCPNRANIAIRVPHMEQHQVIHLDYMCNECGNCRSFCPYDSAPYLDKFTLFANETDMKASKNQGFTVTDADKAACKVRYLGNLYESRAGDGCEQLPEGIKRIMETVCKEYRYLIP